MAVDFLGLKMFALEICKEVDPLANTSRLVPLRACLALTRSSSFQLFIHFIDHFHHHWLQYLTRRELVENHGINHMYVNGQPKWEDRFRWKWSVLLASSWCCLLHSPSALHERAPGGNASIEKMGNIIFGSLLVEVICFILTYFGQMERSKYSNSKARGLGRWKNHEVVLIA